MQWLNILVGAALLLLGRRLFWLFVGCVGFIAGVEIAGYVFHGQPGWVIALIALAVGLVGAVASIFLQRLLVVVAGFLAGGYCVFTLASATLNAKHEVVLLIAYVVGGLLGAVLSGALLDPALIVLSSLVGATAVSQNVSLDEPAKTVLFIGLLILGIMVQGGQYARRTEPRRDQRTE